MKVIILAGGFGTRFSEYTDVTPKPMIQVGGKPLLWHIMKTYAHFGHNDFYIALGYKPEVVKDYFLNYSSLSSDFTVNLGTGAVEAHNFGGEDWNVTLVDTGANSMTGGRVKRMESFIGDETFLLTYGDGVADVNINDLINFHNAHGKMVSMTAVRPAARFGELELNESTVVAFEEKPQLQQGWINGGYFVADSTFFNLIAGDETMLEREPLEQAANQNQLMAYKHDGFWHCMDSKRDHELLESLWLQGAPWAK